MSELALALLGLVEIPKHRTAGRIVTFVTEADRRPPPSAQSIYDLIGKSKKHAQRYDTPAPIRIALFAARNPGVSKTQIVMGVGGKSCLVSAEVDRMVEAGILERKRIVYPSGGMNYRLYIAANLPSSSAEYNHVLEALKHENE